MGKWAYTQDQDKIILKPVVYVMNSNKDTINQRCVLSWRSGI